MLEQTTAKKPQKLFAKQKIENTEKYHTDACHNHQGMGASAFLYESDNPQQVAINTATPKGCSKAGAIVSY